MARSACLSSGWRRGTGTPQPASGLRRSLVSGYWARPRGAVHPHVTGESLVGADLRHDRGTPLRLARVATDVHRAVDAGEARLAESSPGATRFRWTGRGRVKVITFKPLSKNPGALHSGLRSRRSWAVPTKNLIRTVCVTDRAVLGRRTITSVGMADVRSVEVDGRLASFGRSSGRRVSVHGLQAPAIRGCGQAACRW